MASNILVILSPMYEIVKGRKMVTLKIFKMLTLLLLDLRP